MAANRFATLIHRKTNRFTLVLVYAFLEWALIFFILLNSLFSYFILRLADYFGLKRPCLFCSRLDRFFDASGKSPSYRDLLCDDHAIEISRVESGPVDSKGFVKTRLSSDEFLTDLVNRSVERTASSPIEPDLGNIDYSHTWNPIGEDVQVHNGHIFLEKSRSIFIFEEQNVGSVHLIDSQEQTYTKEDKLDEQRKEEECPFIENFPQSTERLGKEVNRNSTDDEDDKTDEEFSCYVSSFDCNNGVKTDKEKEFKLDLAMESETNHETDDKPVEPALKNLEVYIDEDDCNLIPVEFYKPSEEVRDISDINGDSLIDFGAEPDFAADKVGFISASASPDESKPDDAGTISDNLQQMQNNEETDAEVSIGTEIPDPEQIKDVPSQELIPDNDEDDDHEEDTIEFRTITIETKNVNEEQLLETPGSIESLHSLHNAKFQSDQRVPGTEILESMTCPEGVLTMDKLKSELQEERKALNALYEELEEERNASEVAANETMAMINRLHEEKAAMQMEALQYQRMMEEQSEFDQEALQLLNELMVKREKENTELEKELEMYRKRLEEYEAKEKMELLRRKTRDSSVDNDDSDENHGELQNTPVNVVLRFDECLDDYEGEKLSILGKLKFLEEKLTDLNDEDDKEEEVNGRFQTNGKNRNLKSKRLLPLFNAVDGEMENGNHYDNGVNETEIVEELYERLEALESDREFLRNCIGSLKKGDKGINLLHEILQLLRDLRNIDLIRIRENEDMTF